jgi:hypothetical protein
MWRDRADVRLKLKVTATQCHCHESPVLACWRPIYQVWFLFGQTTYCGRKWSWPNIRKKNRHISVQAEERHEKSQWGQLISGPEYESKYSNIGLWSRSASNELWHSVLSLSFPPGTEIFFSYNIHIGSGLYLGNWLVNDADHSPPSVSCSTMFIVYRCNCWRGCEAFRHVWAYWSHHRLWATSHMNKPLHTVNFFCLHLSVPPFLDWYRVLG